MNAYGYGIGGKQGRAESTETGLGCDHSYPSPDLVFVIYNVTLMKLVKRAAVTVFQFFAGRIAGHKRRNGVHFWAGVVINICRFIKKGFCWRLLISPKTQKERSREQHGNRTKQDANEKMEERRAHLLEEAQFMILIIVFNRSSRCYDMQQKLAAKVQCG